MDDRPTARPMIDAYRAVEYLRARHGLSASRATLDRLRARGAGPVYHQVGRRRLFAEADLDGWVESTREAGARLDSEGRVTLERLIELVELGAYQIVDRASGAEVTLDQVPTRDRQDRRA